VKDKSQHLMPFTLISIPKKKIEYKESKRDNGMSLLKFSYISYREHTYMKTIDSKWLQFYLITRFMMSLYSILDSPLLAYSHHKRKLREIGFFFSARSCQIELKFRIQFVQKRKKKAPEMYKNLVK
jgi:hypothetical protein